MYKGLKILSVIPARGGSKGIPRKNLSKVGGIPLVTRAAHISKEVHEIDCTVVSTDDDEIAEAAVAGGAEAPFRRPASLSGDRIGDHPVLVHAIQEMEARKRQRFDVVLMLQPTSPMRRPAHVRAALDLLIDRHLEAVWSLSRTDAKAHPLKQFVVANGLLDYYDARAASIVTRQELEVIYHRDGVVYVFRRDFLVEGETIKAQKTGALLINETLVNIDTPFDLELAEFMLSRQPTEQSK